MYNYILLLNLFKYCCTMKKYVCSATMLFILLSCSGDKKKMQDYPYADVPFSHVHFTDTFWADRLETVRTVTVPSAFRKCEETGRVDNFAIAAKLKDGVFNSPYPFDDSDVYKIIEGASFLLSVKYDKELDQYVDSLVTLIGKAQEPDGYLYTNRTIGKNLHPWAGKERWVNERDNSHEIYNVGHMYEAAVAHFRATGKRNFLDIAVKSADLLCETFGPGKRCVAPGHQVVEMGLAKLYRVTGDARYLDLSHFFLEARGKHEYPGKDSPNQWQNGAYWQDHLPVTQQKEAVGHAVRATYMYSGMADVAALMNNKEYVSAIDTLWHNVVEKKMYITGGIGSTSHGEAFGANYELPNRTAYCETCAAIANCMWNHRMFMLHGEAKYIDVMERSLYNAVLSGLDLAGNKYFYPNPLETGEGGQARSEWFDCSCCPSNLSRFVPSVPGYVYAVSGRDIYVNLFGSNEATVELPDGSEVKLSEETEYPWNGKVRLTVWPSVERTFALRIRIPGWSRGDIVPGGLYYADRPQQQAFDVLVNGGKTTYAEEKGYAVIKRRWAAGDVVDFDIPMPVYEVKANPLVEAATGRVSVERGPIVYCAEFADNGGKISNLVLPEKSSFGLTYNDTLLRGVNVLTTQAVAYDLSADRKTVSSSEKPLRLIPYYARSHRGNGEMSVWLPYEGSVIEKSLLQEGRVMDRVRIGDKVSEKEHDLQGERSNTGGPGSWRDASRGGWFSYKMKVDPAEAMEVVLTYSSLDGGDREFDILVDGVKIAEQKLRTETFNAMIDRAYPVPEALTKGKNRITVKVQGHPGKIAGGIFGCRTQRK